jgi:hypothetical protein
LPIEGATGVPEIGIGCCHSFAAAVKSSIFINISKRYKIWTATGSIAAGLPNGRAQAARKISADRFFRWIRRNCGDQENIGVC